ncbi:hypothetical protein V1478_015998 [Vespula squamosa]|uniref:Uncharacterized protein n=1 Tax=Vespula squamosa TaxID=30214 RepID=A0ABD2A2F5_VESSQ
MPNSSSHSQPVPPVGLVGNYKMRDNPQTWQQTPLACFMNVGKANLLREQRERKKEKQRTIMRFLRLADDNLGKDVSRIGEEEEDDSRGWKVEEDKCQGATRLRSSPSGGNKEASKQQARPERSFNQPPRAQWHS